MPSIAKFTYTISLSCLKDASDNETISYQDWSKNPELREATFKRQEDTFNKAVSVLSEKTFSIEAYSFNNAIREADKKVAKELNCTVTELKKVHYIMTFARIVNDQRTRRILRRRSLAQRSTHTDRYGMAFPYLEAKSHRTDFDTHYMNIANQLDEPTRSEFLNTYNDY